MTQVFVYRFPAFKKYRLYWYGNGEWGKSKELAQKFNSASEGRQSVYEYYGHQVYNLQEEEVSE